MNVYKVKYRDYDNYNIVCIVSANNPKEAVETVIDNNYPGFTASDFYTEQINNLYTLSEESEIIDYSEYK